MNLKLKNFLTEKIKKLNLNSYKLARELGFNEHVISDLIKDSSSQKTLGSAVTIALADYFQVSLDEMVGRTAATKDTDNVKPSEQNSSSDPV